MNVRHNIPSLPTFAMPSCSISDRNSLCYTFFMYPLQNPVLVLVAMAAVIGSFCLLSGLSILYMVSKQLQDEVSEAILLMGMGFFVSSLAMVTWKLTSTQQFVETTDLDHPIKVETV